MGTMVPDLEGVVLQKIGSKLRAEAILSYYPKKECIYVLVRSNFITYLSPDLLGLIFPHYADSITWSDIFIFSQGVKSVSGLVALFKNPKKPPLPEKCQQAAVRYHDESIIYSFHVTDYNNFRSSIFNLIATKEYVQGKVLAKRKSFPENEVPASQVSQTKSAASKQNPSKPSTSAKSAQAKKKVDVQPPVKIAKQQPVKVADQPSIKTVKKPLVESSKQPNVVQVPPSKPKEEPTKSFDVRDSHFVPITSETIGHVLELMEQFEVENRVVAIVFDPCFNRPDITMDEIRQKFEPYFGEVGDNCIFIKTNIDRLMLNLDEAYKRQFTFKGQAYFIGPPAISKAQFLALASQSAILFGLMTIGCVRLNLKKGSYLIHREGLLKRGVRQSVLTPPVTEEMNQGASKREEKVAKPAPVSAGKKSKSSDKVALDIFDQDALDEFIRRSDIVTRTMHKLQPFGNAVIKMENLPAKLTVNALNLMLGTFGLTTDQIIGIIVPGKKQNPDKMNIRIIIKSDCEDMKRILALAKRDIKVVGNASLLIKRTDLKEMETFVHTNYKSLVLLASEDKLSAVHNGAIGIGYAGSGRAIAL